MRATSFSPKSDLRTDMPAVALASLCHAGYSNAPNVQAFFPSKKRTSYGKTHRMPLAEAVASLLCENGHDAAFGCAEAQTLPNQHRRGGCVLDVLVIVRPY
jgi:hypothetical protein